MTGPQQCSSIGENDQPGPTSANNKISLNIKLEEAFKRCQEAGKNRDYETVLKTADEVFGLMQSSSGDTQTENSRRRDGRILASVNGYKGFAL